jgi:hypothetical protein
MGSGSEVVESHQVGACRYDLKLVACGKPTCHKCPHGPYWYLTVKLRHGQSRLRYLGKVRPAEVPEFDSIEAVRGAVHHV